MKCHSVRTAIVNAYANTVVCQRQALLDTITLTHLSRPWESPTGTHHECTLAEPGNTWPFGDGKNRPRSTKITATCRWNSSILVLLRLFLRCRSWDRWSCWDCGGFFMQSLWEVYSGLSGFSTKMVNKKMSLVFCIYCRWQVRCTFFFLLKQRICWRTWDVWSGRS